MRGFSTGTRLDPILESVTRRARERRQSFPLELLRRELQPDPARRTAFRDALAAPGLSILAECKRRSPSAGQFSAEASLQARARAYAEGGARAISVLTEEEHFGGSPADLHELADVGLPKLRKDFLLDEAMVIESVSMGADAVLLLAVCLPDALLGELCQVAHEAGLAVLLEVHDEDELERGLSAGPDCLGVNCRDLRTFEVDLAVAERLLPMVGGGVLRVAESGVRGLEELIRVRRAGADAALVGEALMSTPSPAGLLAGWQEALGGS